MNSVRYDGKSGAGGTRISYEIGLKHLYYHLYYHSFVENLRDCLRTNIVLHRLSHVEPLNSLSYASHWLEVAGFASSVARLRIDHCLQMLAIASWRMEIGDGKSPSAFFYSQIPDTLREAIYGEQCTCQLFWLTWLRVPRVPIPAMTPMLVLEFIIAELIQEGWPVYLAFGGFEVNQWRTIQQRRFEAYFRWQRKNVADSGQESTHPVHKERETCP